MSAPLKIFDVAVVFVLGVVLMVSFVTVDPVYSADLSSEEERISMLRGETVRFLMEVVGLNMTAYEMELVDYVSERIVPPGVPENVTYPGIVLENVTYRLESDEGRLRIGCQFGNGTLSVYWLFAYEGSLHYIKPLPDVLIEAADTLLERQKAYSGDGALILKEARSILGKIIELKTMNVTEDTLTLKITKDGDFISFVWGYETSYRDWRSSNLTTVWVPMLHVNFTDGVLTGFMDATRWQVGDYISTEVTIRSDGSLGGLVSERQKIERDGDLYTLTGDVQGELVVKKDDIIIDGAGYSVQGSFVGINMSHTENVTIRNLKVKTGLSKYGYAIGILLESSSNNTFTRNQITAPYDPQSEVQYLRGISLEASSDNTFLGNTFNLTGGDIGLSLDSGSPHNIISNNAFLNCGITVESPQKQVANNTLNGKPIVYLEDAEDQVIREDAGQVILVNCNRIKVENQDLPQVGIQLLGTNHSQVSSNEADIVLTNSTANSISNNTGVIKVFSSEKNTLSKNTWRIELFHAYNNTLSGNRGGIMAAYSANLTIMDNQLDNGIRLQNTVHCKIHRNNITGNKGGTGITLSSSCLYNTITYNTIANHTYGFYIRYSGYNTIYANNMVDNKLQVANLGSKNTWDNGSIGNYWSDYTVKYPNASEVGDSGIWNTSYQIPDALKITTGDQDRYPLITPVVIPDQTQDFPTLVLIVTLVITVTGGAAIWISRRKAEQNTEETTTEPLGSKDEPTSRGKTPDSNQDNNWEEDPV
ncbi:MAG: right-handed parallel beta-helix repeat-containing protein [Thermoproteota archaeon]